MGIYTTACHPLCWYIWLCGFAPWLPHRTQPEGQRKQGHFATGNEFLHICQGCAQSPMTHTYTHKPWKHLNHTLLQSLRCSLGNNDKFDVNSIFNSCLNNRNASLLKMRTEREKSGIDTKKMEKEKRWWWWDAVCCASSDELSWAKQPPQTASLWK